MKVLLTCRECGHQDWGSSDKEFMNKVKMWNHVRRDHPYIDATKIRLVMKTSFPYQYESRTMQPAFN